MTTMNIGNRRSEEELQALKIKQNKETFVLVDQLDFRGTPEQLEQMQNFERAYISGAPVISDEEWDVLKYKYNYKESVTAGSPSGRNWLKLMAPLPSLEKCPTFEDFENYIKRNPNGSKRLGLKLDGLTANVRYTLKEDGKYHLDVVSSRGNGCYGLILNPFALSGVDLNIPKTIEEDKVMEMLELSSKDGILELTYTPNAIEFRGEALIRKSKENIEKYGENAVFRNIASGMFNRKVPNNTKGLVEYYKHDAVENPNVTIEGNKITIKGADRHTVTGAYANEDNILPFDKLGRNDLVQLENNRGEISVKILRADGTEEILPERKENLDIVFFSVAYDGDNIDTPYLNIIPGLKTLDQVGLSEQAIQEWGLEDEKGLFHQEFDDTDAKEIWNQVEKFYGVENGKRNKDLPRYRNLMEYACDGIVVKPKVSNTKTQGLGIRNNKNNPNKIIMSKYPDDQVAIKLLSEVVRVKLEKIEYNTTSLNNQTCSGILDKPYLTESGAYVSKINLHNVDWLAKNDWIKEGQEYDMVLAMDIIPQLLNPNL